MTIAPELKLDHITVVARNLEEGCLHIKKTLGINMPSGGAHPRMGTHNCLLSLGPACFLELIAIDPSAKSPDRPRWFDLDHFDREPVLSTWVIGTKDIRATLPLAHPRSGHAVEITRGDLTWLISIANDGSMPLEGAFPTLIEWPDGDHPASKMIDLGCRMETLSIEHPNAEEIREFVARRVATTGIEIKKDASKSLKATISTPSGLRTLT